MQKMLKNYKFHICILYTYYLFTLNNLGIRGRI